MLRVEWTKPARKRLRRLDSVTRVRIESAVASFATDGFGDVKPLEGDLGGYRLRVGDWRVLFDVESDLMRVTNIKRRGDAYK